MQRTSPRAPLIGLALAGGLIAALLMFMLTMGGQGTPKAQANIGTNTPAPASTPKPDGLGNLSGLFDINSGPGLYNCIARIDHDSVTNRIKSAAQCYTQLDTGTAGNEPPCDAKHGIVNTDDKVTPASKNNQQATPKPIVRGEGPCSTDVFPANPHPDQPLMPPPPPYTAQQPTKSIGAYCPNPGPCGVIPGTAVVVPGDSSYTVGCFADIGGTLGPNVIAVTQTLTVKVQDPTGAPGTVVTGGVWLVLQATNAQCDAAIAGTAPATCCGGATIPLILTRPLSGNGRIFCANVAPGTGNCPITTAGACTDMARLAQDKLGATTKCGDDPFNPFDAAAEGVLPDVSGNYDLTAEALRSDVGAAGLYYTCKVVIKQDASKNLSAPLLCYVDSPLFAVNQKVMAAAGATCATQPKFCGDGVPGAPPPGCNVAPPPFGPGGTCTILPPNAIGPLPANLSQYQFSHVSPKHTTLTGSVDNSTNVMSLKGCFENDPPNGDNGSPLGNVYATAKINAHTGVGAAVVYIAESLANCQAGTPAGGGLYVKIASVRQNPMSCKKPVNGGTCAPELRDSDGDGCPDQMELGNTATAGGLRDPLNRWDYFNPEKKQTPNTQPVADILATVKAFGKNQKIPPKTDPADKYNIDTDRTGITGGLPWTLGPPDGQQNVVDILIAIKQFGHGCAKAKP